MSKNSIEELYKYNEDYEKIKPEDCYDLKNFNEIISYIDSLQLDDDIKKFLHYTAYRYIDFNYSNIAKIYSNLNDSQIKELFKEMALIVPDILSAYKYGYAVSDKRTKELIVYDILNSVSEENNYE